MICCYHRIVVVIIISCLATVSHIPPRTCFSFWMSLSNASGFHFTIGSRRTTQTNQVCGSKNVVGTVHEWKQYASGLGSNKAYIHTLHTKSILPSGRCPLDPSSSSVWPSNTQNSPTGDDDGLISAARPVLFSRFQSPSDTFGESGLKCTLRPAHLLLF